LPPGLSSNGRASSATNDALLKLSTGGGESIHPVSTHPSVLEELVDGSHIRWGLRVLKAVVSACLLDGYSADRLGS